MNFVRKIKGYSYQKLFTYYLRQTGKVRKNVFRMSHTLKRNLTKLVNVRKKKTNKLKILIFSLFQGKKSWNLKCKLKYSSSIALCKKRNIFWFQEKKIFWDLKDWRQRTICIFIFTRDCCIAKTQFTVVES